MDDEDESAQAGGDVANGGNPERTFVANGNNDDILNIGVTGLQPPPFNEEQDALSFMPPIDRPPSLDTLSVEHADFRPSVLRVLSNCEADHTASESSAGTTVPSITTDSDEIEGIPEHALAIRNVTVHVPAHDLLEGDNSSGVEVQLPTNSHALLLGASLCNVFTQAY
ncbi:MAG: hypothetical protein MHM6MM_008647, partial [Cercozoa sp. M6MM]